MAANDEVVIVAKSDPRTLCTLLGKILPTRSPMTPKVLPTSVLSLLY